MKLFALFFVSFFSVLAWATPALETIKTVGSETMNNLLTDWGEAFKKNHPSVKLEIEGKGSGSAPPALVSGNVTIGPMSRPMDKKERDDFF